MGAIYIAGPMTGIPEYNYPAFHAAAARWRDVGWRVFNPAEHTLPTAEQEASLTADEIRALYMRKDIAWVMESDAVALLPDWQKSKGARAEIEVASVLNLPLYDALTMEPWAESILVEADRLTASDRQADYGHPLDDFSRTAKIITGILLDKLLPGVEVVAEDVPLVMQAVKISREVNHPKRDNRVDGAGYWKTLDMVYAERARRSQQT